MERVIDARNKFDFPRKWECPYNYEEYNEDWYISPDGDMMSSRSGYEIGGHILDHDMWFMHLADKRWFDANTFVPAYMEACRRQGIIIANIRTDY